MSGNMSKGQDTDDKSTKGLSISLPNSFNHKIDPSELPLLIKLLVLFMVK